jgi:hypothetical protein
MRRLLWPYYPRSTLPAPPQGHGVPIGEALRVWTRVAMFSFGGPAIVMTRPWYDHNDST